MANETKTVDNGSLTDIDVSGDVATSGFVQMVKLGLSADGSDTPITADSSGLQVQVAKTPAATSGSLSAISVTTTATLLASAVTNRKYIALRPNAAIYIGFASSVTTSNGFPIYQDEVWEEIWWKGTIYAITATGSASVRIYDLQ